MFKLSRDKYIAALESAEELEKTLQEEIENLGLSSKNLSENWWGTQAELSLGAINTSLEVGNHAKALAYTKGMTSIMGEYLPEIEKLMAKREQIGQQLKQDGYVAPDLTSFFENDLIVNYDCIDDIKADVEGALLRGDAAIQILEEMIQEAEECAGEYLDLTHVRELLEEGKKKLHRLENYRDEFVDFGKKMSDMEYNMSMDLANMMRKLGDTAELSNMAVGTVVRHNACVGDIDEEGIKRVKFVSAMEENFGFDKKTADLIYKTYEGVQKDCEDMSQAERDYVFLRLMGGLYYGTEGWFDDFRWDNTAGKPIYEVLGMTEEDYFKINLGFTAEEYNYLRYKTRIQYYIVSLPGQYTWDKVYENERYKSNFELMTGKECTQENWEEQYKNFVGKGDFLHQMITMATLVSESTFMADVITGSEAETDVMAGWKGDATAGGGFGNDDYCSDLDAVNIVSIMNDGKDFIDAVIIYYGEVGNNYTRAEKFLENIPLEQIVDSILFHDYDYMNTTDLEVKLELIKEMNVKGYNFIINLIEGNNDMEVYCEG